MGAWQDPAVPRRSLRRLLLAATVLGGVLVAGLAVFGGDGPVTGESGRLDVLRGDRDERPTEPDGGRWRRLAPSPLAPRSGHVAVWTGAELLVWGGAGEDGRLRDGAAYDPAVDTWQRLPPSPQPPAGLAAAGVWTGRELVVLGSESVLAYDPGTDRWQAGSPTLPGLSSPGAVTWDGREVVVFDDAASRVAGYDPAADRWRELPSPPLQGVQAAVELLGTVVALGTGADGPALSRYDRATDSWGRGVPVPGAGAAPPGRSPTLVADAVGGRVVVAGAGGAVSAWSPGRQPESLPPLTAVPSSAAGTRHGLLALYGETRSGAAGPSPSGRWRTLGTAPLRARTGERAVWTGGELLVWGGRATEGGAPLGDGASFRPGPAPSTPSTTAAPAVAGSWQRLPPGPVAAEPGRWHPAWAGDEVAALDTATLTLAVHFRPTTATWRAGPRAPRPVRRVADESVWTGREFVVVATHAGQAMRPLSAVAYDPAQRRWRVLASPPVGVSGQVAAAWSGERVLVVAGDREPVTLAYDPAADEWEVLAAPPRLERPRLVAWTGGRLLAFDGADPDRVAVFDPLADRWRAGPDVPDGVHPGVVAAAGERLVVHDTEGRSTAVLEPEQDRWTVTAAPRRLAGAAATGWERFPLLASAGASPALFDPAAGAWRVLPLAPSTARPAAAVWTGTTLLVWTESGDGLAFIPDR